MFYNDIYAPTLFDINIWICKNFSFEYFNSEKFYFFRLEKTKRYESRRWMKEYKNFSLKCLCFDFCLY